MKELHKFSHDEKLKIMEDAWLGIRVNEDTLYNPLLNIPAICSENPELYITYIMSRPEYFSFICKHILNLEEVLPMQGVILEKLWNHKLPMLIGSRGMSKSFTLAIFCILIMLLRRNRKIVIIGGSFRQSKIVFGYIVSIINNSPFLRAMVYAENKNPIYQGNDEFRVTFNSNVCTALPLGTGDTIRGRRATDIIVDEFAIMPLDIFETIIAGFAAVSSSVVGNVKLEAKKRAAKMLGLTLDEMENLNLMEKTGDNKIVLAGTAYYSFNHFSQYHDKWRKIIKSRGNPKVLKALLGEAPEDLDYRDYCVMRIPYELIPRGMMETAQMARSKISMTKDNYEREFGCIFSKDSNGFFKASVLERCTIKDGEDLYLPSGICVPNAEIFFEPRMEGDKSKRHVIGVDPAAMSDNLAIVILELDGQFRKIVHVWTTNKKEHLDKLRSGLTTEHNYYAYAARKIRELMKKFPCEILAIDPGGGGVSIMETLKDKDKMLPNEAPIYHVIDPHKPRPEEDGEPGLHIIEEAEYSSAKWRAEANHGMKKDFEELIILFPYIDPISYAIAETMDEDEEMDIGDDTLQRCINDIDKTKIELCSIIVTETPTGLEHWDTPETKTAVGKKTRMRKDRYSALLIANISARRLARTTVIEHEYGLGGFSSPVKKEENHGKLFTGPSWIADKLSECYR